MAFVRGDEIFLFSPHLTADTGYTAGGDPVPVTARWENAYCPFNGYPEKKRLHRAAFTVFPGGGSVTLTVTTDPSVPLTFEARAGTGTFYTAKLSVTSVGGKSEIRSAALGIEVL